MMYHILANTCLLIMAMAAKRRYHGRVLQSLNTNSITSKDFVFGALPLVNF